MPTQREIAAWRYEQIAPLLDPTLTSAQKRRVRQELCRRDVIWPGGESKPIPRSTLHRWMTRFQKDGFTGLMPARRKDRGTRRRDTQAITDYAIALLVEQPGRSLYLLTRYIAEHFDGYDVSRATLARHLRAHPSYPIIEKLRGKARKLRGRYEAQTPHECWQLDGKGPFRVRFVGGRIARFHILTVLDDHSRAGLAAIVATAENELTAIRVFQKAALRYGLPSRMQFDRGSAFDSKGFRHGLAQLGIHRNAVRPRNPRAQGKIEAFNKSLGRWFIDELEVVEVRDVEHLQQLLDAFIEITYQQHPHRSIGGTPKDRLAGHISQRQVSEQDLNRAFLVSHNGKSDRTTGEISMPNGRFIVPVSHAGKRARFRYDPVRPFAVLVTDDGREIELRRFSIQQLPPPVLPGRSQSAGQLDKILDAYQGRERENAEPAFGLPEVFAALRSLVDRFVPDNESEAHLILAFWNRHGPIASKPFLLACEAVLRALGKNRPLSTYLDHLTRRIDDDQRSAGPSKETT